MWSIDNKTNAESTTYRFEYSAGYINAHRVDDEHGPIGRYVISEYIVVTDRKDEANDINNAFLTYLATVSDAAIFDYTFYNGHGTSNRDTYARLLMSVCMKLYGPEEGLGRATRCLDWLNTTDFFEAPASTRFHDACAGGLVAHTLNVVKQSIRLAISSAFNSKVNPYECALTALVHDWCKIRRYQSYTKNVKDDNTGKWESVVAYRTTDTIPVPLGHGEASLWMAQKFFPMSIKMSCAIRWHMGRWRCPDDDINDLQYANETFPEVHLLQFADQLSITSYANT